MSILDQLDKLRQEPEPRRKRTAFVVSLSLTGIIVIAWFMGVSAGSSVSYNQSAASASTSPLAAVGEAFKSGSALIKDITSSFQEAKGLIFNAASSTGSTTETTQ